MLSPAASQNLAKRDTSPINSKRILAHLTRGHHLRQQGMEVDRPEACMEYVEEAIYCSARILDSALDICMAWIKHRETEKGCRKLAARMAIESMDLLIQLSTCR